MCLLKLVCGSLGHAWAICIRWADGEVTPGLLVLHSSGQTKFSLSHYALATTLCPAVCVQSEELI